MSQPKRRYNTGFCEIEGCEKGHYAHGVCQKHYHAKRKEIDPTYASLRKIHTDHSNRVLRYGLTSESQRTDLLVLQNGVCAICHTSDPRGKYSEWHMDHNHACCGKRVSKLCGQCNRGLLCSRCNLTMGTIEKVGIQNFLAYLENPPAKIVKEGKK